MPEASSPRPAHHVPITELHHFSAFDKAFIRRDIALQPFLPPVVNAVHLKEQIRSKAIHYRMREVLCDTLHAQYDGMDIPEALANNLSDLRRDDTFSVTTAHQPLLFGGKMYVLYKALSTIILAQKASEETGVSIVPIFVIGSEDHDSEEVRYFKLFHNRLAWNPEDRGPVGRMGLSNSSALLSEVEQAFSTLPFGASALEQLLSAYQEGRSFAQAFRHLLHEVLGSKGLIILDADEPALKRGFRDIILAELETGFSYHLTNKSIEEIESAGFKGQAHPREINLFYLDKGERARIEKTNEGYHAVDTHLTWTSEDMLSIAKEHPEKFSPNVILRPLYQETILPNIAFIGGGGELAYWIQLREVFRSMNIPYPLLHRRHSACLVDEASQSRIHKLGLTWTDLSRPVEDVVKDFVRSKDKENADLASEKEAMAAILQNVRERAGHIDLTLQRSLDSTEHQILKLLESFEARMVRGLKHRHESEVQQIRNLFDRIHPNQGLQERQEDFMTWIARFGPQLIDQLEVAFDPFNSDFLYQEI